MELTFDLDQWSLLVRLVRDTELCRQRYDGEIESEVLEIKSRWTPDYVSVHLPGELLEP